MAQKLGAMLDHNAKDNPRADRDRKGRGGMPIDPATHHGRPIAGRADRLRVRMRRYRDRAIRLATPRGCFRAGFHGSNHALAFDSSGLRLSDADKRLDA